MKSQLYRLSSSDFVRGLFMAVLGAFVLPVLAAVQTPNFDFSMVNWHAVLVLAVNGAISAFASYLAKNFFSDSEGKVFGKI